MKENEGFCAWENYQQETHLSSNNIFWQETGLFVQKYGKKKNNRDGNQPIKMRSLDVSRSYEDGLQGKKKNERKCIRSLKYKTEFFSREQSNKQTPRFGNKQKVLQKNIKDDNKTLLNHLQQIKYFSHHGKQNRKQTIANWQKKLNQTFQKIEKRSQSLEKNKSSEKELLRLNLVSYPLKSHHRLNKKRIFPQCFPRKIKMYHKSLFLGPIIDNYPQK